jgi:HEPN domain-containing protein
MNRIDFQQLAELRLKEARALLAAGFPEGAYYLAGYAVECALKACISRRTREHDFPDKKLANDSHMHDLKELVRLALLKSELETAVQVDAVLDTNWTIVQDWSENSRYQRKTAQEAASLLLAVEDQTGGLFPWVRQRW